jgi:hypothetical protein
LKQVHAMTQPDIVKLAARLGFDRLTQAHLARWLVVANAMPDTLPIRQAVIDKTIAPAWGPEFFRRQT